MDKILAPIKQRVLHFADLKEDKRKDFFEKIAVSASNFRSKSLFSEINGDIIAKISSIYDDVNLDWLITGEGSMLKEDSLKGRNLIPFYNDVESVGGSNIVANMNGISQSAEMVDAGDWFPNATAAIRHYNDSMVEYPSGCILALREIKEFCSIIWGRNYVVETDEIRVTKKLQTCPNDDTCIMAYSTNTDTYVDGHLIHEPFKINKQDIKRVFIVLGRVVKEDSSGPVYVM